MPRVPGLPQDVGVGEIDAVIIATPDHWHTLPAIHACQAGKDVYLEKPMTLTIREGRQLVTAVRKYQRVFQTGSQQRSIALNRLGCELVRNGAIGRVQTVIAANYESPWECASSRAGDSRRTGLGHLVRPDRRRALQQGHPDPTPIRGGSRSVPGRAAR